VFHVSQLKKCVSNSSQVSNTLPDLAATLYQVPKKILDSRWIQSGDADIAQVLVQWSNLSRELVTWEDKEALQQQFPMAPVWGQPGAQVREGESAVLIKAARQLAPSAQDEPATNIVGWNGLSEMGRV
jgi:hypothetical protein